MTTHFEAADVLAGAYRGKTLRALERGDSTPLLLVHVVEVDDATKELVRVLCRSVRLDNLTTDAGSTTRWPTCLTCSIRLGRKLAVAGGNLFKGSPP